jgi:hypothetical protein
MTEPTADQAAAPVTAVEPETDVDAGSDEAEAEPESPAQVSNLFARIRSETEIQAEADEKAAAEAAAEVVVVEEFELVEETEADLSPPAPVAPVAPAADAADDETTPDEAPVGPDAELIARRDAALVDIERALGRRIKRELSDEQNELLDSVRRQKGVPSVAEVLPALAVHIARYRDGALASLATAATAGADLLDGPKAGAATKTKAADLATELATELVEPLRDRIERCFVEAADDDEELAERLRACYREWKGQRVDELASRYAVAASNRGLLDRLPKGTLVHWVVDDGSTPSPDCDDNALAGDQPKGEPFPTGHIAPPISATCRCMVVPATS